MSEGFEPIFNHKPLETCFETDLSGWKSPFEVYIKQIATEVQEKRDAEIVAQISEQLCVNVDKEELLKALRYDRNQYQEGYKNGFYAGRGSNPVPVKITTKDGHSWNGYYDKTRELLFGYYASTEVAKIMGYTWEEYEEDES